MTTGYRIFDQSGVYFVTFTIVDWIDIFTRKIYKDIIIESLDYCINNKGLKVYAYVIMSNHLHLIIQSSGSVSLSDIIRDFKKYTAKKILETIHLENESRREWMLNRFKYNATFHVRNSTYQIWRHDNHAEVIYSDNFFYQKMQYIHNNPIKAGCVDFAEDYIYSSAYELSGRGSKIKIIQW